MKLSEIKKAIGSIAQVSGEDELEIRYLLTDSRELATEAEQTLFFAIKTAKNDGANYIPELQAKGVKAFVTGDALAALQALAAYVRSQFDGIVIGITGSNGKTVVKHDATLGANCTIVCGHTIGEYATIAAGAVVTTDVKPHALMAGVPAKQIGWVCECGQVLNRDDMCCRDCHRQYTIENNGISLKEK